MKKQIAILAMALFLAGVSGCAQSPAVETERLQEETQVTERGSKARTEIPETPLTESRTPDKKEKEMKLWIDGTEVPVRWEDNAAVEELRTDAASGEIQIEMSMYGGWEQVGPLGKSYSRNDQQMTAENGDIVLYSGSQIVVFYGNNSWAYTKLGKMELSEETVTSLLSGGDVTLKLTVD